MRQTLVVLAAMGGGLWASSAEGRPDYPNRVPTPYGCETCHLDPNDRLNRNGFGIDFALERGLWVNPAQAGRGMCDLDSDFDGLSNGEELNDPGCNWRPGDRLPGGRTTHPGDGRDPDQCGDGVTIPFAEECDVTVPDDVSCQSLGFDEGEVACTADCLLDVRGCRDLPPDMAPPPEDMGVPDAAPDAMPDEMDAMPEGDGTPPEGFDATPDATPDAMGEAPPDVAAPDGEDMAIEAPADAGEATADMGGGAALPPASDPGDCRAAPGAPGGWGLALMMVALAFGRRR